MTNDTNSPAERLSHELQVHQIELEMQNEALRHTHITLEETLDRFVDFYDCAPVGYLTISDTGSITELNLTCASLVGMTRRDILQHPFARFVMPEDADRWHLHFIGVLNSDDKQDCELALSRGDGSQIHVRLDSLRFVKKGQAPTVRVVLTDITIRKRAEIEIRDLAADLEHRVRARTDELEMANQALTQAKDAAEAANRAKSTFLANMSHEIRTPMNAIVGLTHVLHVSVKEPEHLDKLQKIAGAADHLLNVLNDILDLSKIEANKLVLETSDFDLSELLTRISSMVIDRIRAKRLELIVDIDHRVGVVCGDSTRLSQALLNYLINAVKFTEHGTIVLRAQVIEETTNDILVRFEVEDSGIGIVPKHLSRLFQSFEQADSSMTRRFGGTGLGLAITRNLASLMGGEVGASSTLAVGSTFWMTARLGKSVTGAGRYFIPELKGKRALVVDDTPVTRLVQTQLLREIGLDSEGVASGSAALEVVLAADRFDKPFDLVLIDLLMPGMNGFETLTNVRNLRLQHQPLALLVTASGDPSILDDSRNLGFADALFKPLSLARLHTVLVGQKSAILGHDLTPSLSVAEPEKSNPIFTLQSKHHDARLLLVEDDLLNQEVALIMLKDIGWTIDVAEDGQKALDLATTNAYQLILMDMHMPVMDGVEATRRIRQLPHGKHIPIVAMTANAFTEDKVRCLDAGMNDFVTKPVSPPVLYETILRWLSPRSE